VIGHERVIAADEFEAARILIAAVRRQADALLFAREK